MRELHCQKQGTFRRYSQVNVKIDLSIVWYLVTAVYQPHTTLRSRTYPNRSRYPPMQKTVIKDMLGDNIPEANCTMTVFTGSSEKTKVIGFVSEWVNAYTFVSRKYVLCVSLTHYSLIILWLELNAVCSAWLVTSLKHIKLQLYWSSMNRKVNVMPVSTKVGTVIFASTNYTLTTDFGVN